MPSKENLQIPAEKIGFLSIMNSGGSERIPRTRACDCTDSGCDTDVDISTCIESGDYDTCDADVDGCTDTGN
jgi:hypothetical protein